MAIGKDGAVIRQLRTLFSVGTLRDLTDGQLLERFATGRGAVAELAFAALVERHGPMVLRVCRGVLADPHDIQDAFQATFLVLVEKARALWVRDSLGPWLHQVAFRTASCARSAAARRRRHERRAATMTKEGRPEAEAVDEPRPGGVLHEEIERLPARYRAPLVLCDLEGCTHEQAARHLGWPIGTVKSRLSRGRSRLRDRLVRRGLAPGAGLVVAAPRPDVPDAPFPPAMVDLTTAAALRFATVRTLVRGSAASLARKVMVNMLAARCLKVASVLLVLGATASGVDSLAGKGTSGVEPQPQAGEDQDPKAAVRDDDLPATAVKTGKLKGTLVERGVVEASRNLDVFNQVEGGTTILSILPEGTMVTKGQLVCELDSSALKDQLHNKEIAFVNAKAAYQNARLAREVAELAVVEYSRGIFPQEEETLKGEIEAAESAIAKADARLERIRRARQRLKEAMASGGGATTPAEIVAELDVEDRNDDAEQIRLREKRALDLAKKKQGLLKYTRDKTIKQLQREVEKARSDELTKDKELELANSKLAHLLRQIEKCKLYAPGDGRVIHPSFPGLDPPPLTKEGTKVREGQKIFSVTDGK